MILTVKANKCNLLILRDIAQSGVSGHEVDINQIVAKK